jgi:hypothetical protein
LAALFVLLLLGVLAVGAGAAGAEPASSAGRPGGPLQGTPTATSTGTPIATPACGVPPAWQAGPTFTPRRSFFQGAAADDGKFYVAGGQFQAGQTVYDLVDRFDPATNTWESPPPSPLPVAVGQAAVAATDRRLFVAGGCTVCAGAGYTITSTFQILDLDTGRWSFGPPLLASVQNAAGAALPGRFYVMGGDDNVTSQRTTYVYSMTTNTWFTDTIMPDLNGRTATSAATADGKIYVFGGASLSGGTYTAIDTLLEFNPLTDGWRTLASTGSGPYAYLARVSPYGPNRLLVTGGRHDTTRVPTDTTYLYNIAANTFITGPPMLVTHAGHAQGQLPDGRVVVYGGGSTGGSVTALTELLDPIPPCATATATATSTPPPSPTATPCSVGFTDVDQNNPFYANIRCLACRQIVSGYADGTFRWGADVTRGQLAKIIAGAANLQTGIPSTQQTFEDVPNANTFWLFIERLSEAGAISGYACGGPGEPCGLGNRPYFRWGANATRGQISKITAVTAGWNGPIPSTRQTFSDVPSANPFWLWIEELAARNIISGYGCGGPGEPCDPPQRPYFRWGANATRGQMSKIAANTFYPNCQTPGR